MVMSYNKILDELLSLRDRAEPTKGKSCDDSVDLYRKIDELIVDELNSNTSYWWGSYNEYKEKNNGWRKRYSCM